MSGLRVLVVLAALSALSVGGCGGPSGAAPSGAGGLAGASSSPSSTPSSAPAFTAQKLCELFSEADARALLGGPVRQRITGGNGIESPACGYERFAGDNVASVFLSSLGQNVDAARFDREMASGLPHRLVGLGDAAFSDDKGNLAMRVGRSAFVVGMINGGRPFVTDPLGAMTTIARNVADRLPPDR